MQTSTNIETSVLQLIGPLHMAGQWSVNVRILLASDFPTEAPDICLMSDDRMNPIMTNIIDNNAKVVDTYIDNWHHPENSLCELLRCIVKEFRGECPKKEQSAASHTSSQDRTPRSERMQRTNELPLFTPQTMPKPARVSKPKSSLSCSNRSKPPRPAPRRINSQKVEIRGFIQNANLSKDIEYQLIKNGFTSPMAILCLHDVDVDKLELSLADLYLLKESLTKLRLDRYESYTNTNKPDTVVTDTGERSHGTTTTTTTTSNLFCRGLRRFLDPLIVKEQQLDLGVQLGTGSCGVVYKGWLKQNDASEREAVAVKTIIVSSVNEEQVEKFIAEILQMSTLKHKNVLELKALTVIDEIPHLVLPFMSNGDLLKYVKYPQKNMTVEDLLMLTLDVAHGMKYLNERQIVHCDLAARNCLVDANYNVKVSDFGMAQQLHKSDYIKLPDSKIAIRWMAPEIFKEGKFSIQSDVWSYGILFWEVLTRGKRPYEEISNTNLVPKRIMEGYVMSFPDWVPEKVQQIIAECWQMEAERRPSFSDIISGLNEALLSDTDTATGAAGILAVPKRPVPRFPDGLQPPAPPALHKQSPPVPPKRK
ncbi:hypothetical protein LSH36_515g01008 [Paralvinella palmiformis]|uniref:Protein kinase domain-containing protein n=1 Tax=Paralvinella palmiformis TaxID=53620 RepID=A0AAD9MY78_9ANNE|nr:hypothetical protein LSH36_515g01008 [Paralvinella palmiformis]